MPTAEEVKAYRDSHGVGMLEARTAILRLEIRERLEKLKTRGGTRPDVRDLIDIIIDLEHL